MAPKVFSERVSSVINATMSDGSGDSEDVLRSAVPAALDAVRDLSGGIYDDVIGFSNLLKEENVEVYRVKKNRRKEEDGGDNSKKGEDSEDEHQLNRDDDNTCHFCRVASICLDHFLVIILGDFLDF